MGSTYTRARGRQFEYIIYILSREEWLSFRQILFGRRTFMANDYLADERYFDRIK